MERRYENWITHIPSGLSYPNQMDESIYKLTGLLFLSSVNFMQTVYSLIRRRVLSNVLFMGPRCFSYFELQ